MSELPPTNGNNEAFYSIDTIKNNISEHYKEKEIGSVELTCLHDFMDLEDTKNTLRYLRRIEEDYPNKKRKNLESDLRIAETTYCLINETIRKNKLTIKDYLKEKETLQIYFKGLYLYSLTYIQSNEYKANDHDIAELKKLTGFL